MRRFLALATLFVSLLAPQAVFALNSTGDSTATNDSIYSQELSNTTSAAGISTAQPGITRVIGSIIAGILSMLAVIFLILTIYAGMLWMTAAGNEDRVKKAQQILRNSVIGLIIVLSSYAISYTVIQYLSARTY